MHGRSNQSCICTRSRHLLHMHVLYSWKLLTKPGLKPVVHHPSWLSYGSNLSPTPSNSIIKQGAYWRALIEHTEGARWWWPLLQHFHESGKETCQGNVVDSESSECVFFLFRQHGYYTASWHWFLRSKKLSRCISLEQTEKTFHFQEHL